MQYNSATKHPTTHTPPRPAAPATGAATAAPPGKRVTPKPTKAKPAAAKATTPAAECTTAETAKKGVPGFTAAFVIAGALAVAYAMMRRRGWAAVLAMTDEGGTSLHGLSFLCSGILSRCM